MKIGIATDISSGIAAFLAFPMRICLIECARKPHSPLTP